MELGANPEDITDPDNSYIGPSVAAATVTSEQDSFIEAGCSAAVQPMEGFPSELTSTRPIAVNAAGTRRHSDEVFYQMGGASSQQDLPPQQQRLNISPPNPVINITDAHGRVMPVLVITGGDGTMICAEDDVGSASSGGGTLGEVGGVSAGVGVTTTAQAVAAAGFGPGYFSSCRSSSAGCN